MKNFISLLVLIISLSGNSQNVFKILPGTSVKITEDAFVVSENTSLINDGNLKQLGARGAFKFTGDTEISIAGINAPTFTRLIISKTGKTKLLLQQHISVAGELTFSGGHLDLNNFNVDLGSTGLLSGENESSRVIGDKGGYIQIVNNLNAPSSINPGNLGVIFTTSQDLGRTIIRRSHRLQANEVGSGSGILRTYDISSTYGIGFSTKLRFTYLDAELNKVDENELVVWRSTDNRNWANLGFNSRNKITNYVERSISPASDIRNTLHFIYHIAASDKSNISNNNSNKFYTEKDSWKFWPNPVVEILWINISTSQESNAKIKIVDDKGSLVNSQQNKLHSGNNLLKVDMKRMAAGTYLILVNWAGGQMQKTMKVVKM